MNPATIIKKASANGVQLNISVAGKLVAVGGQREMDYWLPTLREQKNEILMELQRVDKFAKEPDKFAKAPNGATRTISSFRWRFHYPDGTVKEASYSPAATQVEALAGEPDAIKAELFEPLLRGPDAPLSQEERTTLLVWLGRINETDEALISAMLHQCQTDQEARDFFMGLAEQ